MGDKHSKKFPFDFSSHQFSEQTRAEIDKEELKKELGNDKSSYNISQKSTYILKQGSLKGDTSAKKLPVGDKYKRSKSTRTLVKIEAVPENIKCARGKSIPKLRPSSKRSEKVTKRVEPVNVAKEVKKTKVKKGPSPFAKIPFLPSNVLIKILTYSIGNFKSYLNIGPSWYKAILKAFDNYFNKTENDFANTYFNHLLFKDSYIASSPLIFTSVPGIRIDRVFRCETLPSTTGRAMTITYTFKYFNEPKSTYKCEFTFDSVKKGRRFIWIHKNDCLVLLYSYL